MMTVTMPCFNQTRSETFICCTCLVIMIESCRASRAYLSVRRANRRALHRQTRLFYYRDFHYTSGPGVTHAGNDKLRRVPIIFDKKRPPFCVCVILLDKKTSHESVVSFKRSVKIGVLRTQAARYGKTSKEAVEDANLQHSPPPQISGTTIAPLLL